MEAANAMSGGEVVERFDYGGREEIVTLWRSALSETGFLDQDATVDSASQKSATTRSEAVFDNIDKRTALQKAQAAVYSLAGDVGNVAPTEKVN